MPNIEIRGFGDTHNGNLGATKCKRQIIALLKGERCARGVVLSVCTNETTDLQGNSAPFLRVCAPANTSEEKLELELLVELLRGTKMPIEVLDLAAFHAEERTLAPA